MFAARHGSQHAGAAHWPAISVTSGAAAGANCRWPTAIAPVTAAATAVNAPAVQCSTPGISSSHPLAAPPHVGAVCEWRGSQQSNSIRRQPVKSFAAAGLQWFASATATPTAGAGAGPKEPSALCAGNMGSAAVHLASAAACCAVQRFCRLTWFSRAAAGTNWQLVPSAAHPQGQVSIQQWQQQQQWQY